MCPSKPSRQKAQPILPPPEDPAEFLNEELQQSTASRRILGIRQLQAGFQSGGGGGTASSGTGGGRQGLEALSAARGIKSTRSSIRSVSAVDGFMSNPTAATIGQTNRRDPRQSIPAVAATPGGVFSNTRLSVQRKDPRQGGGAGSAGSTAFSGHRVTTRDGVTTFRAGKKSKSGGKK